MSKKRKTDNQQAEASKPAKRFDPYYTPVQEPVGDEDNRVMVEIIPGGAIAYRLKDETK